MAINAIKIIRMVTLIILGLWFAGQPIDAISSTVSAAKANPATGREKVSKDPTEGQVAVQFSRDEVESITEALPEGQARQMFNAKVTQDEEKVDTALDDSLRGGRGIFAAFL